MNNAPASPSKEYLEKEAKMREIRSKDWENCTDNEKIEKLKMAFQEITYLNNSISSLQTQVHQLKQHSHKENGEVVIPISSANSQGIGILGSMKNPLA